MDTLPWSTMMTIPNNCVNVPPSPLSHINANIIGTMPSFTLARQTSPISNTNPTLAQSSTSNVGGSASPSPTQNSEKTRKIFRPVVFQCKHCRSIVADSADLAATDPQQRLVAFRKTTHPNIIVQPEWHLQQEGAAFGSVYQSLACRNCQDDLGIRYHTTNAGTDHLRGLLSLKTEALFMYELQFDDEKMKRDIEEAFGSGGMGSNDGSKIVHEVEITKLQKFCLVLYDRVVRLEEQVIALTTAKGV